MNAFSILSASLICLAASPVLADTELDAGRERGQVLVRPCTTCHGLDGMRQGGEMPAIGELDYFDILYNMARFRSAERFHPVMTLLMRTLDEADMADVAAYFAGTGRAPAARRGPYDLR